jgi:hypothetical protein
MSFFLEHPNNDKGVVIVARNILTRHILSSAGTVRGAARAGPLNVTRK